MTTRKFEKSLLLVVIWIVLSYVTVFGAVVASLSDCLITSDIGSYSYRPRGAKIGAGAGVLASAGHFTKDHTDNICIGSYSNINQLRGLTAEAIEEQLINVKVQVTNHSGSNSDKWLLHEVERDFRNYYGLPGDSYVMRVINGNTIIAAGSGGWDYRWVSGYKVIHIAYTDLQMTQREPVDVVQAYLAKYPSTLAPITSAGLRTVNNESRWIKDEMERRLWLCDKWFMQLHSEEKQQKEVVSEVVKSMLIFLDYREKYFRKFSLLGIKTDDAKRFLSNLQSQQNTAAIKEKLEEYKKWWSDNKNHSISF